MAKVKLPVGRRGPGYYGWPTTEVGKKMEASAQQQREARDEHRARSALERSAERALSAEIKKQRQRDWVNGEDPAPEWSQKLTFHLFVGTTRGLCNRGTRAGFWDYDAMSLYDVPWAVERWITQEPTPENNFQSRDENPLARESLTLQSPYLHWVTCEVCKVALDDALEKGLLQVEKNKKKRAMVVVPRKLLKRFVEVDIETNGTWQRYITAPKPVNPESPTLVQLVEQKKAT